MVSSLGQYFGQLAYWTRSRMIKSCRRLEAIMRSLLLATLMLFGVANIASGQADSEMGRIEFVRSCASCHGNDGKGHGPVAKTLKQQPSDLTRLSENNKGVFPIARVFAVIDGRVQVLVHGSREMPIWGDHYTQGLADRTPRDFMSKELRDVLVRVRILTLVEYLSTIQGK